MEFSSFSSPEISSASPEKKDDSDKESGKDSKKKKSGQSAARLAGLATETSLRKPEEKPASSDPKADGFEGLLQKIRGEDKSKETDKEVPLFGIPKPETETKSEDKASETAPKTDHATGHETSAVEEPAEHAEATPAEAAEQNRELNDAVRIEMEIRLDEVDDELHEMPLEQADTPEAAELAATARFYREVQDRTPEGSSIPVEAVLDEAERVVAEHLEREPEPAAEADAETEEPAVAEFPPEWQGGAEESEPQPAEAAAGEGGSDDRSHGGEGGGNGSGNRPPEMPRSPLWPEDNPPYTSGAGAQPEAAPIPPASPEAAHADAHRALGQGLLVGGIAGYFIGRRRGRRQGEARAERRNAPVRKSLEARLKNLQEVITSKETQIKTLAREKMESLQARKDRERYVEHILQPVPVQQKAEKAPAAPLTTGEVFVRGAEHEAVAHGEIPVAAERLRQPQAEVKTDRPPAEIVPFNKKVEEFSHEELMMTAEKVKVAGTSLKEMVELGQLDEPGLRRVVHEFIRGGDVTKTVAREIKEKELRYEQDPQLRHGRDAKPGSAPASAVGAGGLIVDALFGHKPGDETSASAGGGQPGTMRQPKPDPATLQAIRNKQVATVTATVLIIVAVIIFAIMLTRG